MTLLKKLVFFTGPLLLLLLVAIAGYAYSSIRAFYLPIPQTLALLTVLLPIITGITTHGTSKLILRSKRNRSLQLTIPLLVINGLLLIYETIIATLALMHTLPSPSLTCGLETKWQQLFSARNEDAIKAIQDQFNCCGKNSVVDEAWPFPGTLKSPCAKLFSRSRSCIAPWRQAEQVSAGLILLVALAVFIFKASSTSTVGARTNDDVKIISLTSLLTDSSWAHPKWATGHVEEEEEEAEDDARASMRNLIEQSASGNEYHDEPNGQPKNQAVESAGSQAPRVQPSALIENRNEWSEEGS